MSEKKMDMAKVLAILAQPKEELPPLEHVERMKLEVPYITKENKVDTRMASVVMPQGVKKTMPLIFVPHYEMGEDSLELRDYLAQGWAIACPADFKNNYNGTIMDDDLVFNNAALYMLRHRPEFDKNRIALVGGSAGAYMTLMLNGLQLGHCASIANGPIANTYFNIGYYFEEAAKLNNQAMMKIMAEEAAKKDAQEKQEKMAEGAEENPALKLMKKLQLLPLPFLAGLIGIFKPITNNYPNEGEWDKWEAISAVCLADRFSSPILMNHCTSDVLVPVDQITKKFTYDKPGDSLPDDFDMKIPQTFEGKLRYSLEECLPEEDTRTERFVVPEDASADMNMPYDSSKKFNINIYDDGPAEGYGTHSSRMEVGRRKDVPYLKEMFEKTSTETCMLTPAMLKSFLIRYQGEDITLPARTGVDDKVYGSLVMYRKEVCEELADWIALHGKEVFETVADEMLKSDSDRKALEITLNEILKKL